MGRLVDGVWRAAGYDPKQSGGRFVRAESQLRNWITADGSPGRRAAAASRRRRGAITSMSRTPAPGRTGP